ncbi:MAG: hypothetical protein MJZ76_06440 [Bacteroidales bacterium]|nr:hypothetical protein [Bacteroidales bacterium]
MFTMNTISYMTSILTFYIKGIISANSNFVEIKIPNTFLALIPLGAKKEKIAVNQISSVQSNFKLRFGKLVLGLFLFFVALAGFSDPDNIVLALLIFVWAVNCLLDGFEVALTLNMTSGKEKVIDFFIFEKNKAQQAEELINDVICGRMNDTNGRRQTDRIIDAIYNKNNE